MTMHSSLKSASKIAIRRNVLKRFEHVYALLVATSSGQTRFYRLQLAESEVFTQRGSKLSINQLLQQAAHIMISESQKDNYLNQANKNDLLVNI